MKKLFSTFIKNDEGKPFTAEEAIIFGVIVPGILVLLCVCISIIEHCVIKMV